jgi:hypothetical protein
MARQRLAAYAVPGAIDEQIVAQQEGASHAEAPHRSVSIQCGIDAASQIINGPTAAGAKLIDERGIGKVLMGFFLAMFAFIVAFGLWIGSLIRSDVLNVIRQKDENHVKVVVEIVGQHEKARLEQRADDREREKVQREIEKERETVHREAQSKQWGQLKVISDSNIAQTATLQKATEIMTINGETMKRSGETMERTVGILIENSKMLKSIADGQKK